MTVRTLTSHYISIYITINGYSVERTNSIKYLGIKINQNLSWSDHIEDIIEKCNRCISIFRRVYDQLLLETRSTLYSSMFLPVLDYSDIIFGDKDNKSLMDDLQMIQNKAAKVNLVWPIYIHLPVVLLDELT